MIRTFFKKALRIGIWTSCFLALTIYTWLQIQDVRGVSSAIEMVVGLDYFPAALGFFLCLIGAFIADLFYTSHFE